MATQTPRPGQWHLIRDLTRGVGTKYRFTETGSLLLSTCRNNGAPFTNNVVPPTIELSLDQAREIAKAVKAHDEEQNARKLRQAVERSFITRTEQYRR